MRWKRVVCCTTSLWYTSFQLCRKVNENRISKQKEIAKCILFFRFSVWERLVKAFQGGKNVGIEQILNAVYNVGDFIEYVYRYSWNWNIAQIWCNNKQSIVVFQKLRDASVSVWKRDRKVNQWNVWQGYQIPQCDGREGRATNDVRFRCASCPLQSPHSPLRW